MKRALWFFLFLTFIFSLLSLPGTAYTEDELRHVYFIDVEPMDAAIVTSKDMVLMIDEGNAADSSLVYSMLRNTLSFNFAKGCLSQLNCLV